VTEEFLKFYVAYRAETNFVEASRRFETPQVGRTTRHPSDLPQSSRSRGLLFDGHRLEAIHDLWGGRRRRREER
jgi:hypothetical protein